MKTYTKSFMAVTYFKQYYNQTYKKMINDVFSDEKQLTLKFLLICGKFNITNKQSLLVIQGFTRKKEINQQSFKKCVNRLGRQIFLEK